MAATDRRRTGGTRAAMVDLVIGESEGAWTAEVLGGIERVAHERGIGLTLTVVRRRTAPSLHWLDSLIDRGTEGIIVVRTSLNSYQRAEVRKRDIPTVLVGTIDGGDAPMPSVAATNRHGSLAAMQHLAGLGHQRIAMISGPRETDGTHERISGYEESLMVARIPVDGALMRFCDFSPEEGRSQALALLGSRKPPTAIFTGSDLQALGVYQAAHELKLRVPEDLSVVGFDDLPFASWTAPPLTTVRQPLREMGAAAMRMVSSLAESMPPVVTRAEFATNLVVRASTTRPR